jgi:hypothetical protein
LTTRARFFDPIAQRDAALLADLLNPDVRDAELLGDFASRFLPEAIEELSPRDLHLPSVEE